MKMNCSINMKDYRDVIDKIESLKPRVKIEEVVFQITWLPSETVRAIYAQWYQRFIRKLYYNFNQEENINEIYKQYCSEKQDGKEDILLSIADKISIPPALLAKFMLGKYVEETEEDKEAGLKSKASKLLCNTSLICDPHLAQEVEKCIMDDEMYGPASDSYKHSLGLTYEVKLEEILKNRNLSYLNETQQRKKGYDKTPDFILDIPIAVDGRVVSWVESKALFGDKESHSGYLKDQLWNYWNRWGPGLVIYWFGFIQEIDCNRDEGIIVMDHFPENIVVMKPEVLATEIECYGT